MTGLGVGHGPRPRRARPRGDRRGGGRARARARRRAPAREPPLPGRARRVRGGVVRRLHRRDAVRRRGAARPLAVRRAARARRWPTPALRLADDGTDPDGPASAPFDGEGSPTRRTPLIEDGRLLGFLYDSRTARKAGPRDDRQREPRLLPHAAVGRHVEPDRRAGRRATSTSSSREAGEGLYVTDVAGPPFRRQPGVRHVLGGRLRPADRERRARHARCARSRSPATSSRC